jgi:hypothetical protein
MGIEECAYVKVHLLTLASVDGCLRNCTHRMSATTPCHNSMETEQADSRMSLTNLTFPSIQTSLWLSLQVLF